MKAPKRFRPRIKFNSILLGKTRAVVGILEDMQLAETDQAETALVLMKDLALEIEKNLGIEARNENDTGRFDLDWWFQCWY